MSDAIFMKADACAMDEAAVVQVSSKMVIKQIIRIHVTPTFSVYLQDQAALAFNRFGNYLTSTVATALRLHECCQTAPGAFAKLTLT